MNFENEETLNDAMRKLGDMANMTTKSVKKLNPKIMICNVHKEETESEIIDTVIERNEYLQSIDEVETKISVVFSKPASGGTLHYILRCDPEVRKLLRSHNDKVKLQWGVYIIRDRYHALACYYCQRFGHTEKNCNAKVNEDDPHCFKCAGNHRSKDCTETTRKCINCVRYKKSASDHSSMDHRCPILMSELDKIRNLTDHGY